MFRPSAPSRYRRLPDERGRWRDQVPTNYTPDEIKQIAQISDERHIRLLTDCGVPRANARTIIAMPTDQLTAGIAAVEARADKTAAQEAMIAAGRRELMIRQ